MAWCEYHGLTKHTVDSLRRTLRILDWANMPNPFRHDNGVPVLDLGANTHRPLAARAMGYESFAVGNSVMTSVGMLLNEDGRPMLIVTLHGSTDAHKTLDPVEMILGR